MAGIFQASKNFPLSNRTRARGLFAERTESEQRERTGEEQVRNTEPRAKHEKAARKP